MLPAGAGGSSTDADSWVAQWRNLFEDGGRGPEPVAPEHDPRLVVPTDATVPPTSAPASIIGAGLPPAESGDTPETPPGTEARPGARDERDAAEIAAWHRLQERSRRRAKVRAYQRRTRLLGRALPRPASAGGGAPRSGKGRRLAAIATTALLGAGAAVVYVLVTSGVIGGGSDTTERAGDARTDDGLLTTFEPPSGIQELARAAVQLIGLDEDGRAVCAGSGVVVESDGTILTNAHVVTRTDTCRFSSIGVAVAANSTAPAELRYRAELLEFDRELDLAVLRITGMADGVSGALPDSFVWAPLGDSDSVALGDGVRILGFPVIGGDTITLTTGTVSGFSSQTGVGDRALIKTDATISAGNSGGMALDRLGRVIGIPSMARASEDGPAIDCRALTDSNDDGFLDDSDECVPVGGFINGIRPINLALPLLRSAESAQPIAPPTVLPVPDFDPSALMMTNPRFALGREGNIPVDLVRSAPAGIAELCFFVDWSGIPQGLRWDGAWFIDGELEPALGKTDQLWSLADSGRNFWLCAGENDPGGLPAGVYEVGFFLDNELIFAEGITLTEEPAELVTVTWANDTGGELCELAINPIAPSGQVGLDELDLDEPVQAGGTITMQLPVGTVVVEAYDCDGAVVAGSPSEGLLIVESKIFSITR